MHRCFGSRLSRVWLGLTTIGVLLLTGGCYEQRARVIVYPDGSGRILVTRQFQAPVARLIEAQTAEMGLAGGVRADELFFSEKRLKADARRLFGRGVRLVSARPLEHNGARGSLALYAFDKIDAVVVRPDLLFRSTMDYMNEGDFADEEEVAEDEPEPDEDEDVEEAGRRYGSSAGAYRFAFQPGPQPRLTVRIPASLRQVPDTESEEYGEDLDGADEMDDMMSAMPPDARASLMSNGNPLQLTGKESSRELMAKLCKGMNLRIEVEVRGAAVTGAASHPDALQPGRFALMAFDVTPLLTGPAAAKLGRLQRAMYGDLRTLLLLPGTTLESRPEVLLTLAPPATP